MVQRIIKKDQEAELERVFPRVVQPFHHQGPFSQFLFVRLAFLSDMRI